MKTKLLTITICAFLCALMSCKKDQSSSQPNQESTNASVVDKGLINEVITLSSYTERKAAYTDILSGTERYTVWAERSQVILNSGVLNSAQAGLFKQAVAKLNVLLFTSKTERYGQSAFFDEWKIKAAKVFTQAQLRYLISDVAKFDKEVFVSLGKSNASNLSLSYKTVLGSGCGCSVISDWCGSQGDCLRVEGCTANGYCGTFLVYECNGKCALVMAEEQHEDEG